MLKTTRNPMERLVNLERLQMAMIGVFTEEDDELCVLEKDKASMEADRVSKETG
jgi:hypothetical protein